MNVLVIGKGGREHAIIHALKDSPQVTALYALPGNPGMAELATLLPGSMDSENIIQQCDQNQIELVIVGPEDPLVEGLVDILSEHGLKVFGPSAEAAQLEGSKIFAKNFMINNKIPTAKSQVVSSLEDVNFYASSFQPPYVLKADGLAGGKGVFICDTLDELKSAADKIFNQMSLGTAGASALLEQFQEGYELSFFVLTDGHNFEALPMAQDHKKLQDGDMGPNTGGMGTVAPMKVSERTYRQIIEEVVEPTIHGLAREKFLYRGVVFIGLMMTPQGPQVLEYNVRFGDPETQVLLPLLKGDWGAVFLSVATGSVPKLKWEKDKKVACVVLAAQGYPECSVSDAPIAGSLTSEDGQYFLHAGTRSAEGQLLVSGGRVLNAIGFAGDLEEALKRAYCQSDKVRWEGLQKRKDIGKKALEI